MTHDAALPPTTTVGPDSLTWRYIGDVRFLLFGLSQAFIVQVAHPVVSQGVEEFSTFRTDPYGRFMRSIALLWPATYNTPSGQAARSTLAISPVMRCSFSAACESNSSRCAMMSTRGERLKSAASFCHCWVSAEKMMVLPPVKVLSLPMIAQKL